MLKRPNPFVDRWSHTLPEERGPLQISSEELSDEGILLYERYLAVHQGYPGDVFFISVPEKTRHGRTTQKSVGGEALSKLSEEIFAARVLNVASKEMTVIFSTFQERIEKLESEIQKQKELQSATPLEKIKAKYKELLKKAEQNPEREKILEASKKIIEIPEDRPDLLEETEDI